MEFQPLHMLLWVWVTISECLHQQVYDLGEDPGSKGWLQERELFVWLPELLRQHAGQGQPQLWWSRTGVAWAASPPLLRSCPRTGLLSIGMLLIGNRWSLADWASRTRQAGGHTCIHNHTYILTHCHSQSPIHTSKHKHKYTPTNTPSHSLENTTHKPSVTRTHKSHK